MAISTFLGEGNFFMGKFENENAPDSHQRHFLEVPSGLLMWDM